MRQAPSRIKFSLNLGFYCYAARTGEQFRSSLLHRPCNLPGQARMIERPFAWAEQIHLFKRLSHREMSFST
jgi:hypothetical protein